MLSIVEELETVVLDMVPVVKPPIGLEKLGVAYKKNKRHKRFIIPKLKSSYIAP